MSGMALLRDSAPPLQMEKDQELLVKARLASDEAERKRVKELENLKAKMKAKEAIGEAMGADRAAQLREDEARMIKAQEALQAKVNEGARLFSVSFRRHHSSGKGVLPGALRSTLGAPRSTLGAL